LGLGVNMGGSLPGWGQGKADEWFERDRGRGNTHQEARKTQKRGGRSASKPAGGRLKKGKKAEKRERKRVSPGKVTPM